MAGDASVQRFNDPTKVQTQDTLGVTQFGRDGKSWNQTIGGLTIQGGQVFAAGAVSFVGKYEKQVLGVFLSNGVATAISATGFTAPGACYWWAIGV